ncbi:low temperature requirement protein A [Streptacidiphilus monticola]
MVSPFLVGIGGFTVGVGHFVERHGLAVLILLGESIAEVGAAASHERAVAPVVLGALLALALSAALWWLYFDREDRDSESLLEAVPPELRGRSSLYSYGYAYLVLIFGIAVAAVGMEECVSGFDVPLHGTEALLLPLGLSLFLFGAACFHRVLARSWPLQRLAAAGSVWTVLPAARVAGWCALVLATALVVALTAAEGRSGPSAAVVAEGS